MRLTKQQKQTIIEVVQSLTDEDTKITLFGSRTDDSKQGGDVDLLLTFAKEISQPAVLSAKISARLLRAFQGRKVDILLSAPNLQKYPIHTIAKEQGIPLL